MLVAAWGMWQRRYWAVLGFEALLAITLCIAALSLLVASNVAAVVLCVAILGPAGWLFWKLIRVMGRLQAAAARSLDSGALWLTPSTTASSSARVRAATSPRSAPPSSA